MRFYVVTYRRRDETTRLGATSAAEAIRAISAMLREGWTISHIRRGTEEISTEDLRSDAAGEASRPQG